MSNALEIIIITPDQEAIGATAEVLNVRTPYGAYGIMANHSPLFLALSDGAISLIEGGRTATFEIKGAFLRSVANNKIEIICQSCCKN